jgi:hypothetical protein
MAARRSNPDHHSALSLLALSLPGYAVKAQAEHPMSTAKQFRAKAAESAESLKHTVVPSEIREFQRSMASFEALADNEDWLTNNFDKIVHSPGSPRKADTPGKPDVDATVAEIEERVLRPLGAAVRQQKSFSEE